MNNISTSSLAVPIFVNLAIALIHFLWKVIEAFFTTINNKEDSLCKCNVCFGLFKGKLSERNPTEMEDTLHEKEEEEETKNVKI